MNDLVPTQVAAKGVSITQFDLDSMRKLGLVKCDLLGITRADSGVMETLPRRWQRPRLRRSRLQAIGHQAASCTAHLGAWPGEAWPF